MKKISLIAALVLILGSTTIAMAGQHGKSGECGLNPRALAAMNLTAEQTEKIRTLR